MSKNPPPQQANETATAGVIVRPTRLFPAAMLLGLVSDYLVPWHVTVLQNESVRWIAAIFLILLGLALFIAGLKNFSRADTPVPTNEPARALVTSGIYGWTRNPIYVGMFLLYGGIGIAAQSPYSLILMLPLAITIHYGVVLREEAYLERRFGEAYRNYKSRVRRWL